MSEFFSHRDIKATRKAHRCEACGQPIEIGGPAYYFSTKQDGYFYDGHYHDDCRAAELALNQMKDCWGDDYIGLNVISEEPDDCVWLRETFPVVAERVLGAPEPAEA